MQNQDCFILLCTYTNVHHRIHRKINMQVVVNNQDTHHHSSKEKSTTFHLLCKNHKLYLAPMVLQSELAFRLLCKKYNQNIITYTPMISSKKFVNDKTYRKHHFQTATGDRPLIAQFCGDNAATLIEATNLIKDQIDAVDLNLGCPENIARKGNYGTFLLRNTKKVVSIVKEMVEALKPLPVTCKIRLLEYGNHIPEFQRGLAGTIQLCQDLENVGCSMICVHARTRHNKGRKISQADFDAIREIKNNVQHIPIIANGNIASKEDIVDCYKLIGNIDGIMSAEAILGNPTLFEAIEYNNENNIMMFNNTKVGQLHMPSEIAKEYIDFAEKYPPFDIMKIVKPHVYRILHGLFQYDEKLLERLQKCKKDLNEYKIIIQDAFALEQKLLDGLNKLEHYHGIVGEKNEMKTKFISTLLSSYYYRHRPKNVLPERIQKVLMMRQIIQNDDDNNNMNIDDGSKNTLLNIDLQQQRQLQGGGKKLSQHERRMQLKEERQKWMEFGVRISR